jgi:hypothetical protein
MSSAEPESGGRDGSAQPGAQVERDDVPSQQFREELSAIQRDAKIDELDDLATQFDVTEINNELTGPPPPYSEIGEQLSEIKSRAKIDELDDLATLDDVTEINNELTGPPPPYSEISAQLSEIKSRAKIDELDHLADQHGLTAIDNELTGSPPPEQPGISAKGNREARIKEVRERLEAARDTREANTAEQANDDIGRSLNRSLPLWIVGS